MELATVFAKLGSDVTVIEQLSDALPEYENDVTTVVRERAEGLGVDFRFEHGAEGWSETADGVEVRASGPDGEVALSADHCLVAVGREPVTDTLDPDAAGLELDESGAIATDETAATAVDDIYAVGDVTGEPMLAHAAFREGEVAASVIAGEPAALDQQAVPAAVFTDPEVATVGMSEDQARDAGYYPVVGRMPLASNGRALTLGDTEGFVRIVADKRTELVLGAQIVGPNASELIAEVALAIEMDARLSDIAETVHTHPTLSEAVMEAAANARGEAIHTAN
jgi:dihydrolipoamide dehydrogenase